MHGGKDEKTALFLLFDDTQLITSKVRQPSLKFFHIRQRSAFVSIGLLIGLVLVYTLLSSFLSLCGRWLLLCRCPSGKRRPKAV